MKLLKACYKNKKIKNPIKIGDYFIRTISILTTGLPHACIFSRRSSLPIIPGWGITTPSSEIAGDDVGTLGRIHTHHPGLYNIVTADESKQHFLEILVKDPGLEIFTFTFG